MVFECLSHAVKIQYALNMYKATNKCQYCPNGIKKTSLVYYTDNDITVCKKMGETREEYI